MNRVAISAVVNIEIAAEDEGDAWDQVGAAFKGMPGFIRWSTQMSEASEVPYKQAPKEGAHRWYEAARRHLFDIERDFEGGRRPLAVMHDGSWWWTNGHLMLRCEGAAPEDWRIIPEPESAAAVSTDRPRKPTFWSRPFALVSAPQGRQKVRRALVDQSIAAQATYIEIVEASEPSGMWLVGDDVFTSIHYVDREGKLIAVLMGMLNPELVEPSEPNGDGTKEGA